MPQRKTPLLSILCITYNHELFIEKAINSFLEQESDFDFEIIIGEDCSTDKTLEIALTLQKQHSDKIKVIYSKANVGITKNFRRALANCKGKYIALCEGDDYWTDAKKIQHQVEFLENNIDYVITYHDNYVIDDHGEVRNDRSYKGINTDVDKSHLIKAPAISTLTVCFRNLIHDLPTEFDQAPILDLCLWSLLGSHGKGKFLKDIKPSFYRIHEGGVFSSKNYNEKLRMTAQSYIALSKYHERVKNIEVSQYFNYKAAEILMINATKRLRARLLAKELYRLLKI